MTTPWTVTFDCADAVRQAAFWKEALGYVDSPPPTGWTSWEQWLRDHHVPEDEWGDGGAIVDPEGRLPRVSFLKVPEGKTVKNRLHVDLQVSGGRHVDQGLRRERIMAHVERLVAAGATLVEEFHGDDHLDHVILTDPEGNELCVV